MSQSQKSSRTTSQHRIVAAERLADNQTVPAHTTPFSPEALAENHSGHLTDDQARRFQLIVGGRRKGTRGLALPVGAIGALLLALSGPAETAVKRHLAGWGFVAAAAAFLAAPTFDPLAADVRDGRVETVQGAIGKRRVQSPTRTAFTRYYLNIAGRQLRTYLSDYDAAPDAGYVRAYYLPRTRRLVNLERLPNPPLPSGPDEARDMFGRIAACARQPRSCRRRRSARERGRSDRRCSLDHRAVRFAERTCRRGTRSRSSCGQVDTSARHHNLGRGRDGDRHDNCGRESGGTLVG